MHTILKSEIQNRSGTTPRTMPLGPEKKEREEPHLPGMVALQENLEEMKKALIFRI